MVSDSEDLGRPQKTCIFSMFQVVLLLLVGTTLGETLLQTLLSVAWMNSIICVEDAQIGKHEHYMKILNIK